MSWRSPTIQIYESSPTKTLILPITKYFGDRHAHFVADTHKNGYPNHEKIASFINDLQSGFQKRIQIGELPSCALYFGILLIWPRGNLILLVPKQWILFFVEPSCTSYWLGAHIPIFKEVESFDAIHYCIAQSLCVVALKINRNKCMLGRASNKINLVGGRLLSHISQYCTIFLLLWDRKLKHARVSHAQSKMKFWPNRPKFL